MVKPPKRRRLPGVPTPEEIHEEVKRRRRLGLPPLSTPTRAERLHYQRMIERSLELWRKEKEEAEAKKKRSLD